MFAAKNLENHHEITQNQTHFKSIPQKNNCTSSYTRFWLRGGKDSKIWQLFKAWLKTCFPTKQPLNQYW